jgi:hypothetical protein
MLLGVQSLSFLAPTVVRKLKADALEHERCLAM